MSDQKTGFGSNCRIEESDAVVLIRPESGPAHLSYILRNLALIQPAKNTRGFELLSGTLNLAWGSCIFYITPYLDEKALSYLVSFAGKGHSVSLIDTHAEGVKGYPLESVGIAHYHAILRENAVLHRV